LMAAPQTISWVLFFRRDFLRGTELRRFHCAASPA